MQRLITMWHGAFALLGLTGSDRQVSFTKLVTLAVLLASVRTGQFGLGIAIAVLAASFGAKTFLAFLQSRTVTATSHTAITADLAALAKVIRGRRDNDHDAEATP